MFNKKSIGIYLVLIMIFALSACSNDSDSIIEKQENQIRQLEEKVGMLNSKIAEYAALEDEPAITAVGPSPGMTPLVAAINVLDAMKTNDYATLSSYVDSGDGVYVSPYQYIDLLSTINLTDTNVLNIATDTTVFTWGNEPGSGAPITLNMMDYYNEYIYDEDYYVAPVVGMNLVVSTGNMTNNIAATFTSSDAIEFYFPQFDPSFGGLDWSSITLVFDSTSGMPMLEAIAHGQWTP